VTTYVANSFRRVAAGVVDLVDKLSRLIPVHAELVGAILDLVGLVHVDLAAVRRPSLF
jgi:hypothetical protein